MNPLKSKLANTGITLTLVYSIICFAAMARNGYYDGQTRHTELSSTIAPARENGKEQTKESEKDDDRQAQLNHCPGYLFRAVHF